MKTKNKDSIKEIYLQNHSYAKTGRIVGLSRQRVYQIITGKYSPTWWNKPYFIQRGGKPL